MLGATSVLGVDVDPDALEVALENARNLDILPSPDSDGGDDDEDDDEDDEECGSYELLNANVENLPFLSPNGEVAEKKFDTLL